MSKEEIKVYLYTRVSTAMQIDRYQQYVHSLVGENLHGKENYRVI